MGACEGAVFYLALQVECVQCALHHSRAAAAPEPLVVYGHAGTACFSRPPLLRSSKSRDIRSHQSCAVLKAPVIAVARALVMHVAYVQSTAALLFASR